MSVTKLGIFLCVANVSLITVLSSCFNVALAVNIDTVLVGDPGNSPEPGVFRPPIGGVSYTYRIGKYEVTIGQYVDFLNAVAVTDTYGLYNPLSATDQHSAGIAQSGIAGSYTYSAIGSPNRPVTYVSWGDAARFANWLHNGQPTGMQNASTTEDGAYTLNGATSDEAVIAVSRNAGAKWFIPTEDEWYKAAYYEPAERGGDVDNYWLYPMRTNGPVYSDQPPGATPDNMRVGNFLKSDGLANGYDDGHAVTGSPIYSGEPNYLTDVGAYSMSPSFYGTFDQGGNVYEWNEAITYGSPPGRGVRGGAWNYVADRMESSNISLFSFPRGESSFVGFRLANAVPEPSTTMLGLIVSLLLGSLRPRVLAEHAIP